MDELLALLGQHWRLLLLYPGGLAALGTTVAAGLLLADRPIARPTLGPATLVVAALWLLIAALLPLPQTGWPFDPDVVLLLVLVELPYWWLSLRSAQSLTLTRAAALLGCYPLLGLALALIGQGTGSLVLHEINRGSGWLRWSGLAAWGLVLPPLLGLGPWRSRLPGAWLLALRRAVHIGLLIAAALPAHDNTSRWAALLAFGAALGSLALLDRLWHGDSARWDRWQPWLAGGFGLLLVVAGALDMAGRLP